MADKGERWWVTNSTGLVHFDINSKTVRNEISGLWWFILDPLMLSFLGGTILANALKFSM